MNRSCFSIALYMLALGCSVAVAQAGTSSTVRPGGQPEETIALAQARAVDNVVLEAEKDAYFRRDLAIRMNDNYGSQEFVAVGTGREPVGEPDAMRASVQFDLSSISAARLRRATLILTVHSFDNGAASSTYQLEAHRIVGGPLASWNEGNGLEGEGAGLPGATDPDSAYGIAWSGAGDNPDPAAANNETQPDFDPLIAASATVNQGSARPGDEIRMDVTSLVSGWVHGSVPNHGIMLIDRTTDGLFRGVRLGAREGRLFGIPGAVTGPRLVIEYSDGDLNGDGTVDIDDLAAVAAALDQTVALDDPRDLDGDGRITVLDLRRLVLLCSRPRCARP